MNNPLNSPSSSENSLSARSLKQSPFRQKKAGLCTRLQSYKDIRLEVGEKWAIKEGSLVVGINPSFTVFDQHTEHLSDEFEISTGDFYIVCSLYADLWALCIKMSFDSLGENDVEGSSRNCFTHLGFLPLCAVTLAANYSSFVRRCLRPAVDTLRHPGNGLPVMPPERSHSLNASKQIFRGNGIDVRLSAIVYDACNTISLENIDMDYIPLDSTLQQLFSDIGARRDKVHQLGKRMSLRRLWQGTRSLEPRRLEDVSFHSSLLFRDLNSGPQSFRVTSQRLPRRGRCSSSSSAASHGRVWSIGTSTPRRLS